MDMHKQTGMTVMNGMHDCEVSLRLLICFMMLTYCHKVSLQRALLLKQHLLLCEATTQGT